MQDSKLYLLNHNAWALPLIYKGCPGPWKPNFWGFTAGIVNPAVKVIPVTLERRVADSKPVSTEKRRCFNFQISDSSKLKCMGWKKQAWALFPINSCNTSGSNQIKTSIFNQEKGAGTSHLASLSVWPDWYSCTGQCCSFICFLRVVP